MPYQLPLPNPLPSDGWKVKIHDAENPYEDPHVTIYRKLQKWRLRLRDRTFMDRGLVGVALTTESDRKSRDSGTY